MVAGLTPFLWDGTRFFTIVHLPSHTILFARAFRGCFFCNTDSTSATAPTRLGRTIAPTMTRADKTHVSLLNLMFALVLLACVSLCIDRPARRSRYMTDMQKPRTRRGFIVVAPNGVDPLT